MQCCKYIDLKYHCAEIAYFYPTQSVWMLFLLDLGFPITANEMKILIFVIFSESSLVTEFHGNSSHTDHFKLLKEDGTSVLVGARNIIYNLSLPDLQEYTDQVRRGQPTAQLLQLQMIHRFFQSQRRPLQGLSHLRHYAKLVLTHGK